MLSRVIGPLLGPTVNCADSPMAVTGAAATENTVSMTNATRVDNARNEDACLGGRAAPHKIGPADRLPDRLPNKKIMSIRFRL